VAGADASGTTVAHYLAERGVGLSIDEFRLLAVAMAERLTELHSSGWIHGDSCPASFIVSGTGLGAGQRPENASVRVTLIGSAWATPTDAVPTSAIEVDGALPYVAPERTSRMQTPFDRAPTSAHLGQLSTTCSPVLRPSQRPIPFACCMGT